MSIKTSNTDFKTRIRQQIEDPIMRKAVANAQQQAIRVSKVRIAVQKYKNYTLVYGCNWEKLE